MNVLKPNYKATITTLLEKGVSQREIHRKTGVDRKTIRKYARLHNLSIPDSGSTPNSSTQEEVTTGSGAGTVENPPPRPPVVVEAGTTHSASEAYQERIEIQGGSGWNESSTPNSSTQEEVTTGSGKGSVENPPPRPPIIMESKNTSSCEAYREWIETQVRLGRPAMAIYQDLVEQYAFTNGYNSVKRFVRKLKDKDPKQYDRLDFLMGEEAQVDYGQGAPTLHSNGKYRKPRLFVMTLKYSGKAFRKVVWESSQETWARLHEEAFRDFGGCPQYVTLDNLKEGVIKPDIYDPELNPLYAAMLEHYKIAGDPARVRDANRKGTVENAVKYTQNTGLKGRRFKSIELQNDWLRHWEKRWASVRIHGRAKRQVQEMFEEEKPYLAQLPLTPFRYFQQETRTVHDDGTIQVGKSYYAANPAPLHSKVVIRIYSEEIEILDPQRMEIIRRHPKSNRPGSLVMQPSDRIFNPSRETDRLLAQAERIGPHTFSLCEMWFDEEGRCGQRRMYGLINLIRRYPAYCIEKAAELAKNNGLKSFKAIRRMVESFAEESAKEETDGELTKEHPLIRPGHDYAAFWDQHAAEATHSPGPKLPSMTSSGSDFPTLEDLRQIWQQADWLRVIEVFHLSVDGTRRRRDDEIWIRSPFTKEKTASMHLSLSENIYKDFSSDKGGGIMQFCRDMLRLQGRDMTMFEVGRWMISEGISTANPPVSQTKQFAGNNGTENRRQDATGAPTQSDDANPAISIDLRRFLQPIHPVLIHRGISTDTCRYLGCGFLPQRKQNQKGSPLNSRLVFQIRGVKENDGDLQPVILSHIGRALTQEQEDADGKYWSYPFRKGLELYNQDRILLDEEAGRQVRTSGLILVEGFFDCAKLVEAGCRNVAALMGASISQGQIKRLLWIRSRILFPRIFLFLDRDQAGATGAKQVAQRLRSNGLEVTVFDWDRMVVWEDGQIRPCPASIQDPADMSTAQIRHLREQGII